MKKKIMCIGKVIKGQIIYLQVDPEANGINLEAREIQQR